MHVRCARIEREGGCLTFQLVHCVGNDELKLDNEFGNELELIIGSHMREIPAFAAYKIAMFPDPVVQLSR